MCQLDVILTASCYIVSSMKCYAYYRYRRFGLKQTSPNIIFFSVVVNKISPRHLLVEIIIKFDRIPRCITCDYDKKLYCSFLTAQSTAKPLMCFKFGYSQHPIFIYFLKGFKLLRTMTQSLTRRRCTLHSNTSVNI